MFEIKKDEYGFDYAEATGTGLTASTGIFSTLDDKLHARMYVKKDGKEMWSEDIDLQIEAKNWDNLKVVSRLGPQEDFYNVDIFTSKGLHRILQFVFIESKQAILARVWGRRGEVMENFGILEGAA